MLRPVTKEQQRLLELASFLEELAPEKFSMGQWGAKGEPRCICGWFMHNHALRHDDWRQAASMMGIDEYTASKLFDGNKQIDHQEAAHELRYLAWVL